MSWLSALGLSWQYVNHSQLLVHSVYRFHVCFHVQIILHHLVISLSYKDGFSKVKSSYNKSAYSSIWVDFSVIVFLVMEERPQKGFHDKTLHER